VYALALIRYRRPLEEVIAHQEPHRAYQRELLAKGLLLASGPWDPRFGGMALLRVPDDNVGSTLDAIRDNDPFVIAGVAQYEMLCWAPVIGKDKLDKL
jgi:uncharacterized protein YciI